MWFATAELLRQGYIRNVYTCVPAIEEICSRLKTLSKNKKEDVETKSDFKARNKNKSPDHCDSLCGLSSMIVELRLTPKADTSNISSKTNFTHWINVYETIDVETESMIEPLSR